MPLSIEVLPLSMGNAFEHEVLPSNMGNVFEHGGIAFKHGKCL